MITNRFQNDDYPKHNEKAPDRQQFQEKARQQRDEEIRTYLKNLENGTLNEKPKRPLVQIKIDNIFLQANGKKKRGWTLEDAYNSGIFIRWQTRQLYMREYLAREKLIKKPRPSRISAATSKSSK